MKSACVAVLSIIELKNARSNIEKRDRHICFLLYGRSMPSLLGLRHLDPEAGHSHCGRLYLEQDYVHVQLTCMPFICLMSQYCRHREYFFSPVFSELTLNGNNTTTLITQTKNLPEQHLQIVDLIPLIDVLYPVSCSYPCTSITMRVGQI